MDVKSKTILELTFLVTTVRINILWYKGLTKDVCPDSLRLVFKLGVLMLKLAKQHATRAWSITVCVLFIVSTLLSLVL
uniref:Uncharacterized protein n=1 Tax=Junco hyemalis TaxID=40217 RepID=A0A8C5INA0_JUNHY